MPHNAPIGLYDSGLGGLSVAREILAQLPGEAMVYVGDTARVPYGARSADELIAFNREILAVLVAHGVKAVVVACNTSSAIALPVVASELAVPILGLIEAGARAAITGRRIGVIATQATVRSGAYQQALTKQAPGAKVFPLACPQLVPLVESGLWTGKLAEATVLESIGPLLECDLDTLVLGCTHYPFLAPILQAQLGPGVHLVDPAREVVGALAQLLAERQLLSPAAGPAHRVLASGDPEQFTRLAARLLGDALPPARHVAVAAGTPAAVS